MEHRSRFAAALGSSCERNRASATLCLVPALALPLLLAVSSGPALEWDTPVGCPSAAEVRARMRKALVGSSAVRSFAVRVSQPDPRTWRMETTTQGGFGSATRPPAEAGSCADLVDNFIRYAVTVWDSWAIAPSTRRRSVRGYVRIAGQGGFGLLPRSGFGGGQLVFGLVWRRARIELGLAADRVDGIRLDPRDAAYRTDWVRGAAFVRGCGVLAARSIDFLLCAGVQGGVISGRSAGPWNGPTRVFDVHAAPGLVWWFHRAVGLWAGISGGPFVQPLRPRHEVTGETFGTTAYYIAGGVGFEFRPGR